MKIIIIIKRQAFPSMVYHKGRPYHMYMISFEGWTLARHREPQFDIFSGEDTSTNMLIAELIFHLAL